MRWAAVAAGLCFVTASAHGINLPEHDLTSLVLLSDFVVLVDQFEKETMPGGSKVAWCRVTKVYKGTVPPGAEFPRPRLGSYAIDRAPFSAERSSWDKEAVIFLVKIAGRKGQWDAQAIEFVPSGLRLLKQGLVYRPLQEMNPGPYVPTPERNLADGSEVRLAELEKELETAILRVAEFDRAQALEDHRKRSDALFELLGPPISHPVFAYTSFHESLSDAFTARILKCLDAGSNLDVALEAFARCRSCEYRSLTRRLTSTDFLNAASDEARSAPQRATALRLLQGGFMKPRPEQYDKLAALLRAKEPEVRRRAACVIDSIQSGHGIDVQLENQQRRPLVEALAAAWKIEVDPLTRTVLFSAGDRDFFVQPAGYVSGHPIRLEGCVSDGTAHYVCAFADGHDRVASGTFVVAEPAHGGPERRSLPLGSWYDEGVRADGRPEKLTPEQLKRRREIRARSFHIDTGFKRVTSNYVEFDPPLAPGKYKMWIEGRYSTRGDPTLPQESPELVLTTRPCEVTIQPESSNPEKPK